MGIYHRGDKRWRKYNPPRINCKKNQLPLWQALNPFTLNLTISQRRNLYEYIAHHKKTRNFIGESPNELLNRDNAIKGLPGKISALRPVSFSPYEPKPSQIREFRTTVYEILPSSVKSSLDDFVEKKYEKASRNRLARRPQQAFLCQSV